MGARFATPHGAPPEQRPAYAPACYLYSGNQRAGGAQTPQYNGTFRRCCARPPFASLWSATSCWGSRSATSPPRPLLPGCAPCPTEEWEPWCQQLGSGLSSSASLELGVATALLALSGLRFNATLALFLLVATVMPVGDALLVWQRGGEPATLVRHIAITAIVLLTWFLTSRWVRRASALVA